MQGRVYTIGVQRLTPAALCQLASDLRCTVVDVRRSRGIRTRGFTPAELSAACPGYAYKGAELGEGAVSAAGIHYLEGLVGAGTNVLLVGYDEAAAGCHRFRSIGARLVTGGAEVFHVYMPEDACIAHTELLDAIVSDRDYVAEELREHRAEFSGPPSAPPPSSAHAAPNAGPILIRVVAGPTAFAVQAPYAGCGALRLAFKALLVPAGWKKFNRQHNVWQFPPAMADEVRAAIASSMPGAKVEDVTPAAAPTPAAPADLETKARAMLGLAKGFSKDDLKSAFRKAALKHHPDRGGNTEVFKQINAAHTLLTRFAA